MVWYDTAQNKVDIMTSKSGTEYYQKPKQRLMI